MAVGADCLLAESEVCSEPASQTNHRVDVKLLSSCCLGSRGEKMKVSQKVQIFFLVLAWFFCAGCASGPLDEDSAASAAEDVFPVDGGGFDDLSATGGGFDFADPSTEFSGSDIDFDTADVSSGQSEDSQLEAEMTNNDFGADFAIEEANNNDSTDFNAQQNQAQEAFPPVASSGDSFDSFDTLDVESSPVPPAANSWDTSSDFSAPQAQEIPVPESNLSFEQTLPTPQPSFDDQSSAASPPSFMSGSGGATEITGLQYKANQAGGTVVISASSPPQYSTRVNRELNQFIVEVPNATLPSKYKRPLNMRDMGGSFGGVDAYQDPGSSVARFVVQLRDGVAEPVVQAEGNSLLVISGGMGAASLPKVANLDYSQSSTVFAEGDQSAYGANEYGGEATDDGRAESVDRIFTSQSLYQFLAGNTKFYGRKISIEMNSMDIRDAIKFISDESGANIIFSDEVQGTISLKLKQVPWDQALLMVMRAKKLGYTRQGTVLRIAPLAELKSEEEDAGKLITARKTLETLKVKVFAVSYSRVEELEKKVKEFLSERGKVIGDVRTSSLVVTDVQDHLDRVAKLLISLDRAPSQVFIEAKIIEAKEAFVRNIGVSWGFGGGAFPASGNPALRPQLRVDPASTLSSSGGALFNMTYGTIDGLGTLDARIALSERDQKVKVLSAPQLLTLNNEPAKISQTTEIPIKSVTIANGVATETFSFKSLSLSLEVNPQITSDNSVILKLDINRQFRDAAVSITDDTFAVNARQATTKVLVKNGQTAVIGGIYQSDSTEGEAGVPWLKDIPLLGSLFKQKSSTKDKVELMIFLTPRIVTEISASSEELSRVDDSGLSL